MLLRNNRSSSPEYAVDELIYLSSRSTAQCGTKPFLVVAQLQGIKQPQEAGRRSECRKWTAQKWKKLRKKLRSVCKRHFSTVWQILKFSLCQGSLHRSRCDGVFSQFSKNGIKTSASLAAENHAILRLAAMDCVRN